jgi:hypothetical protein
MMSGVMFVSMFSMSVASLANAAGLELNSAAFDSAWEKRHELCPQILDLGKVKPQLPNDYEINWRVGRFIYFGGFFCIPENAATAEKMDYFKYGVDVLEKARQLNPKRVEGHYWYASVYGGYALAKGIRASLSGAPIMRDALTEAIKIDPKYHFAGPYRVRGRLFFALPSFISFGDNKLAFEDLKKATELGPENKLNYVYFAEVQAKIEDKARALATLEAAKKVPDVVGVKEDAAYRRDIRVLEEKLK